MGDFALLPHSLLLLSVQRSQKDSAENKDLHPEQLGFTGNYFTQKIINYESRLIQHVVHESR